MNVAVSIDHLQSRLVSLMEQVRTRRREDAALRAEVLLSMNQLCSPGMLLGLWQMLEAVGPREELMLVRLLRDMESAQLERVCNELIASTDELVRSVGYGVVALRSRRGGAQIIADAFDREPGLVLKRGGRRHLAPHSFVTCMLAGIREFKQPELDKAAMRALREFAHGQDDLDAIVGLLDDDDPQIAKLGFVTLCSRFMGKLHRFAYEDVVCGTPWTLTRAQRGWMRRALLRAPEVVEAIAEPGPTGVGDADFVRARISILRQFGGEDVVELVDALASGRITLPSVTIERRSGHAEPAELDSHNELCALNIAYLLAALIGARPALAGLVEGLADDDELEFATLEHLLELSGTEGALNIATALLVFWHELDREDSEQGPFWRWIDGLWGDDRHDDLSEALAAALARPDETSLYGARVLSTLGDGPGRLLSSLCAGQPIDLGDLSAQLEAPHMVAALRAVLHDRELAVHPQSLMAVARAGLEPVESALRAAARHTDADAALVHAARQGLRVLHADRLARQHPLYGALAGLGLHAADRELVNGEAIAELTDTPPDQDTWLLKVYFWLQGTRLPSPVGARPATGYAACARFLMRLPDDAVPHEDAEVLHASWSDREGLSHELLDLDEPPSELIAGFGGVPWGTPLEALADAALAVGARVLATAPQANRVETRSLVDFAGVPVRLETDGRGRLHQAIDALHTRSLDESIGQLRPHLGKPLFRTGAAAVWRFRHGGHDIEIGVRPDPAYDTLARYVRSITRD